MSIELLYTSAPKGLKHGSRGFCTVLMTAQTPGNIAAKLESLSGFRQLYPPDHAMHANNPVAHSHYRITVGGKTLSVLSRIAAYGTDYTGRTNKIAHHVVPDAGEQPPAGPAWVLMQPSVMRTVWSGECETPPQGPAIPGGAQVSSQCAMWKNVTGDAGWAGVVADTFQHSGQPPTWLIYQAEQQHLILPLIHEAVSLLPAERRWQATFNTYATNVPPDVDCRLRCVLAGTEEGRFAAVKRNVIDMTKPMGMAGENQWTLRARGVQLPEAAAGSSSEATEETPSEESSLPSNDHRDAVEINLEDDSYPDIPQPWNPVPATAPRVQPPPIHLPDDSASSEDAEQQASSKWLPVLATLFVVAVGLVTWWITDHLVADPDQTSVDQSSVSVNTDSGPQDAATDAAADASETVASMQAGDATNTGASANKTLPEQQDGAADAMEPMAVTLLLRYDHAQLITAVQRLESGKQPLEGSLRAMGVMQTELAEMPAAVGWRDQPRSLLPPERIMIPDYDPSLRPRTISVARVDDSPSFSGAVLRSFVGIESHELVLEIAVDPDRSQSIFSEHVQAFLRITQALEKMRLETEAVDAVVDALPEKTRIRVRRLINFMPRTQSKLAEQVIALDNHPNIWDHAADLAGEIDVLSRDGGPSTWGDEARSALLKVNQRLKSMNEIHDVVRNSLEALLRGQRLHVPDIFFYDADHKTIAALDLRLIVSW